MKMTSLLLLAALLQDAPQDGLTQVNNASAKLLEKKNYGFVLKTKVDGDAALLSVLEKLDQDVTGIFQKEMLLHAKAEDIECVKNGGDALFLYQKKWRNREDTNKLFGKNKLESPTKLFDTMDNPHDEIGSVREKVSSMESKGADPVDSVECTKFVGPLTDEGANTLAKIYFGRLRVKGGGKSRGTAEPSGGKGTAAVWINKDGVPVQLQYDLSFRVTQGKSEWKASLVRTVTVSSLDSAKIEIPAEVKKQLKIE